MHTERTDVIKTDFKSFFFIVCTCTINPSDACIQQGMVALKVYYTGANRQNGREYDTRCITKHTAETILPHTDS